MLERLKEQPAVAKLVAQYDQLPRRDQQALSLLAIAILVGILYFAVWQPVAGFHDRSLSARDNAADLLGWIQANEPVIQGLAGTSSSTSSAAVDKPDDGRALMALVTSSAREAGLALQRFEPSGDEAIRVWLDGVPYADVASWLERLNTENGVVIDQAAMDRGNDPGKVSVRLTLTI
ncbi:type II secretion system protein GspM [Marinobacter pelagius]|uniref:Type II secretion system protein M n=1 Tax=Marinobacter pelagius TaxID=379482 RepID=A0A1I4ZP85_9GAMM|nr:type II secretion system protein M [Marinobacter pelagius]SFN51799.1 general secretion pathway protein M [Marinobacter pelagius]